MQPNLADHSSPSAIVFVMPNQVDQIQLALFLFFFVILGIFPSTFYFGF